MKTHILPGLIVYVCLKSMEVTHSPVCREVLIVSGVSILNNCVWEGVQGAQVQNGSLPVGFGYKKKSVVKPLRCLNCYRVHSIFVQKLMQCLHQAEVPVKICLAAYDSW